MTSDLQKALQKHLGGNYTVERELFGGGLLRVFVAVDHRRAQPIALKVLPSSLAVTVSVERFQREIMRAAGLQHPHIVPVMSAGELEQLPYFIMPFVYGESLRTRLAQGPLSVSVAVGILKDVAEALAYAHESGVVHQDLKPDNILLAAGSAVVADFGVAEALSASRDQGPAGSDAVGFLIGTPAYMAPEQASGDPVVDPSADLYTFGIIAYEMLAGVPPFHGKTSRALLKAQVSEAPRALASYRSDVPVALDALISQCLEKVPANRPKSASEVGSALESPDCVSEPFAVPPVAPRRSRQAVMLGVVLTAAIAVFFFFPWSGRFRIEPVGGVRAAMPVLEPAATVPTAKVPAAVPAAKVPAAVPTAKIPAAVPTAMAPAAVPTAKAPVAVPISKTPAPVADPAVASVASTPVPVAPLGRSLAVLPLSSSGLQRDASIAAGATSELTNALSQIAGLRVASQTTVTAARGGNQSVTALGATLGVTLLIEGSVQSAGKKLRISLRVVRVANDSTIWARRFDGTTDNIFAIQDAATRAVVAAVSTRLK